ncbi:MAG: hypothetical protein MJ252_12235 [archaeon]|nr:hypothetical protein [archaeon]
MGCKCTKKEVETEITKAIKNDKPTQEINTNLPEDIKANKEEEKKPEEGFNYIEPAKPAMEPENNGPAPVRAAPPQTQSNPAENKEPEEDVKGFKKEEEEDKRFIEQPPVEKEQEEVRRFIEEPPAENEVPRRFDNIQIDQEEEKLKEIKEEPKEESKEEPKETTKEAPKDNLEAPSEANQSKLSGKVSKGSKVDYKTEALRLINQIRKNPKSFIQDIEEAKKKIETKDGKLIYAGKVKVALKQGEPVFQEAIDYLGSLDELSPLNLDESITIKVPDTEEQIKNNKYLPEQAEAKKAEGVPIESHFKDSVKDFYTSVLLLIIDDSGKAKGKKRGAVLNPKFSKIGIDYKKVGKTFCAYYTFAK